DGFGSTPVSVWLEDTGGGANRSPTQTFTITIDSVNDAPRFTKGADQTVNEDATQQTVPGWVTGIEVGPTNESSQTWDFEVSGSPLLQSVEIARNGTLTYPPKHNAFGKATVSVRLKDSGGTDNGGVEFSPWQTFDITINAINDAPTFTKGTN